MLLLARMMLEDGIVCFIALTGEASCLANGLIIHGHFLDHGCTVTWFCMENENGALRMESHLCDHTVKIQFLQSGATVSSGRLLAAKGLEKRAELVLLGNV
jgi:hypothetical protein